jgi:hypothetical protein
MLISIAASRLGFTPIQIYSIDGFTPIELNEAIKDYDERESVHYRSRWEVMRMQIMMLINMTRKKNKQLKNPQSIMRFPWEEDFHSKKEMNLEEQKGMLNYLFGKPKKAKSKEVNDGW